MGGVRALAIGLAITFALGAAAFGLVRLLPQPADDVALAARIARRLERLGTARASVRLGTRRLRVRCDSSVDGGATVRGAGDRPLTVAPGHVPSAAYGRLLVTEPALVYLACPPVLGALIAARVDDAFQGGKALDARLDVTPSGYRVALVAGRRRVTVTVARGSLVLRQVQLANDVRAGGGSVGRAIPVTG